MILEGNTSEVILRTQRQAFPCSHLTLERITISRADLTEMMKMITLTGNRDDEGRVHGVDAQRPGASRQVEVGDEIGQLAEDHRPGVDAEEGVLQQRKVQHLGPYRGSLRRYAPCRHRQGLPVWLLGRLFAVVPVLTSNPVSDQAGKVRGRWRWRRFEELRGGLVREGGGVPAGLGGRGVRFGGAIGYRGGGAVQAQFWRLLLRCRHFVSFRRGGGGRGGRGRGEPDVDGSEEHPGGYQIQHEAPQNQQRPCLERTLRHCHSRGEMIATVLNPIQEYSLQNEYYF